MIENEQGDGLSPQSKRKRPPWFILTGIILGMLLGLAYAWWINPIIYENAYPANLNTDDKETYRVTIAEAFAATGNLERASQRLELINDQEIVFTLGAQAQRALADGEGDQAYALALLASALQSHTIPTATLERMPTQTLPQPTIMP